MNLTICEGGKWPDHVWPMRACNVQERPWSWSAQLTWAQVEVTLPTPRPRCSTGQSTSGCCRPGPASASTTGPAATGTAWWGGSSYQPPGRATAATTPVCPPTPPRTGSWSTLSQVRAHFKYNQSELQLWQGPYHQEGGLNFLSLVFFVNIYSWWQGVFTKVWAIM